MISHLWRTLDRLNREQVREIQLRHPNKRVISAISDGKAVIELIPEDLPADRVDQVQKLCWKKLHAKDHPYPPDVLPAPIGDILADHLMIGWPQIVRHWNIHGGFEGLPGIGPRRNQILIETIRQHGYLVKVDYPDSRSRKNTPRKK